VTAATAFAGRLERFGRPEARGLWLVVLALAAAALYVVFAGQWLLPHNNDAPTFEVFNNLRVWVDNNRNSNPILVFALVGIRGSVTALFEAILLALNALTWPGLTVLGGVAGLLVGGWRLGGLMATGFLSFGVLGLWDRSVETLALTLAAVLISLLVGIPLGIIAGRNARFYERLRPILDAMQIMPTYAYLAPFALLFLIGPATALIVTAIYAIPPAIRITAHGIRSVPPNTVEASVSLGSTRRQTLFGVLVPVARRTIVLGINQTIMAALSMVTIAALIDAPGLGQNVLKALQTLDVGTAFNAGLAIVVMAIVLDRVTTAMSERVVAARQMTPRQVQLRPPLLVAGGVVTLVCVYLSYTYSQYAIFPEEAGGRSIVVGDDIARGTDSVKSWAESNLTIVTSELKDFVTAYLLDPVQSLLTDSPWFVVVAAILALSLVIGSVRSLVTSAVCLAVVLATGLWGDSMVTLASTLVATVLTLGVSVVVGVWMGRSPTADRVIRPLLDAAQTLPSFVYLIPFVALFAASRFTAIIAALVYAAPISIKLIADGIRGVSATTVEAARSVGTNTWQMITKVQLPMAREALVLATNQGLIYVLSMVVIGGLVGAGALGYDVVAGFRQSNLYGKGLAAGLAIVMLGIMLDRITQAAARRSGGARR